MKRDDDFKDRHQHLKDLTDEQIEARFWELANKLVDPLLQMCYGAGNVVYRLAKAKGMEIRPAGLELVNGRLWDEAADLFKGGNE